MKFCTYNVNGIRSAISKGFVEWLGDFNPDILCLQEIKISETQIITPLFESLGYHCFWYPAQKKGYSGVGVLTKVKPNAVEYGMGIDLHDNEGRVLTLHYENFSVMSVYFPSGSSGDERQAVKMKFLDDFSVFIEHKKKSVQHLIIGGDMNICHQAIDIHNPKNNANTSGFLPEERAWVSSFLENGFVDTFRHLNKEPHQYSWWSYRAGAKAKNLGWRIDYFFISQTLQTHLIETAIHADVTMSDHCPVSFSVKI